MNKEGKEENSFHGNVCAYLTCRLMGDPYQSEFRLDSRLKHAGMTVFGKDISLTQQAAGN